MPACVKQAGIFVYVEAQSGLFLVYWKELLDLRCVLVRSLQHKGGALLSNG